MKNIFKFMGIAVMACSMMMVSCGKDPAEPTDTTPDTPVTPTTGVTVKWDGETLNLGFKDAYQSDSIENLFWFEGAKAVSGEDVELPWIFCPFWYEGGAFNPAFCVELQGHALTSYDYYMFEVYDEGAVDITFGQGEDAYTKQHGDYLFIEGLSYTGAAPAVTFDATAMTLTTHFAVNMYNYLAATQGQVITKELDLNFVNYKFDTNK